MTVDVIVVMPLAEQRGGAELMLKQLVTTPPEAAPTTIHWHVVFLEDGPMVDECRSEWSDTHVFPAGRLRHVMSYGRTIRQLVELGKDVQARGILGWMSKGHVYGGPAAFTLGCPAFWFQLGLPADVHWMDRLATAIPARRVLTCSNAGAKAQAALFPHRRTAVVHPGTDVRHFAPGPEHRSAIRRRLGLDETAPTAVIVGRLQRWKGMHVFIESIDQVRQDYPDVQGIVVGGKHDLEPEYPQYLKDLIQRRNLEESIHMVGFQSNVRDWMHAADVVVHASDREPFGIVVIEAMASARPVIASDTAGPTEVIEHGQTGLLTPYGDAEAMAKAIVRYFGDAEFSDRVAHNAAIRARSFSVKAFASRINELLIAETTDAVDVPSPRPTLAR
ncbi:glycosyl transferase family 1 [Longibacter salinarum]|uniref:Glycosyl transferase family 1 n=1 Tax=Longibacter salinarum TaxID=1850348 RepID=A0A2A8CW49_9BACT|nr:glycosyltransferase family 4 protein [Longibacter salinarum]PEN12817.1 glycosyl transferase family 1 [Longibacter salinarum]